MTKPKMREALEWPLKRVEEAKIGKTLRVLRDADKVLRACAVLVVNDSLRKRLTAAAGSVVLVLRTDLCDGTVLCRVPSLGDLWFVPGALSTEVPRLFPAHSQVLAAANSQSARILRVQRPAVGAPAALSETAVPAPEGCVPAPPPWPATMAPESQAVSATNLPAALAGTTVVAEGPSAAPAPEASTPALPMSVATVAPLPTVVPALEADLPAPTASATLPPALAGTTVVAVGPPAAPAPEASTPAFPISVATVAPQQTVVPALEADLPAPTASAPTVPLAVGREVPKEVDGSIATGEAGEDCPEAPPIAPQCTGPAALYEVLAEELPLWREPRRGTLSAGSLARGRQLSGTPHLVDDRLWLHVDAAMCAELLGAGPTNGEVKLDGAWLAGTNPTGDSLLQPVEMIKFVVRDDCQNKEIQLTVPNTYTMNEVKEAVRKKLGKRCTYRIRLAERWLSLSRYVECSDTATMTGEDLYLLDPYLAESASGQLRREVAEVAADRQLACCSVRELGALSLEVRVAPSCGGSAMLRLECPPEYPFRNCVVQVGALSSPEGEDGWCGVLSPGQLVGPRDPAWSPSLTLRRLLLGVVRMMSTWPGSLFYSLMDAVEPYLDQQLRVVYISVGCGGPFLAQKIPRAVQQRHQQSGGRCLLVLVDPLLTYPAKPRNEWRVSADRGSRTVVCTCNAIVEEWDLEYLDAFIVRVSNLGVRRENLVVADHRGASFMCAPCPITAHLAADPQPLFSMVSHREDVALDDAASLVLQEVHGIYGHTKEDRETMKAMAHGDCCLSFGLSTCTGRELSLLHRVERHGTNCRTQLPSELLLLA